MNNQTYLQSQNERESNARSYPRRIPIAIDKADGIYVTDVEGNKYLDCLAGAGTLALGHNHPVVIEAIEDVLHHQRPLHTLDITTPMKEEFVNEIYDSLPEAFAKRAKIQFCGPTGSDAIEAAVKLVKTATGRSGMLSFQGGYHGMTNGALGMMGNIGPKEKVANVMSDVQFLPYPYAYRCPFGVGGKQGTAISSNYIERLLTNPEGGVPKPAGMVMELVQGEGGAVPAPTDWVKEMRRITKEQGIPLILDEVQTGIGRTGKMFAFEHADITPDVLVLSKAIGGTLPLSVVIYDEKLDTWAPGAHSGTFRGNQMAIAAGTATLQYVKQHQLDRHAEAMGEQLMNDLKKTQTHTNTIGNVRGRGLMIGVEIVNPSLSADSIGSHPEYPEMAKQIQKECFDRGLILELGGRYGSVVRFLPPLIITKEQVEEVSSIFHHAVEAAENKLLTQLV